MLLKVPFGIPEPVHEGFIRDFVIDWVSPGTRFRKAPEFLLPPSCYALTFGVSRETSNSGRSVTKSSSPSGPKDGLPSVADTGISDRV